MVQKTLSVAVPAPRQKVFDYVANIENLPRWATCFCQELRQENGAYKVVTPKGEIFFRIEADPKTGVVDMFGGPAPDQLAHFPTRVVDAPGGASLYLFTMFQGPGMSEEEFEQDASELRKELDNIQRQFAAAR